RRAAGRGAGRRFTMLPAPPIATVRYGRRDDSGARAAARAASAADSSMGASALATESVVVAILVSEVTHCDEKRSPKGPGVPQAAPSCSRAGGFAAPAPPARIPRSALVASPPPDRRWPTPTPDRG